MQDLKIYHVGFYNKKEHHIQEVQHLCLCFHLRGLIFHKDGNTVLKNPGPFCSLHFPGDKFEFEYGEGRKNWVAQFSCSDIKRLANDKFSFTFGEESIELPSYIEPPKSDLLRWEKKFSSLVTSFRNSTPHERMLTQIYLVDMIKYYIEAIMKSAAPGPAEELKKLIDSPDNMSCPISELSVKCGYSIDHLRVLFKQKYGISPQEYRIRNVMAYAMELVCKSNLMISDISDECAFTHLSHFSALFKKTHGVSPSEALKRFRYR